MSVESKIVESLRQSLPNLLAVYLFGSRASGASRATSDWDVALWAEGKVSATELWELSHQLALVCGADVDLVDLGSASTVMQYQSISGRRLWQRDARADNLEAMVLKAMTELDEARAPLLRDIHARGTVYGG